MKEIASGLGASRGCATGPIRVIRCQGDIVAVAEGDVVVVPESSPAWTLALLKAAAVVTETGGIISHIAIVAREMGLPCVVGVKQATSILQDRTMVMVNGEKGVIYEA